MVKVTTGKKALDDTEEQINLDVFSHSILLCFPNEKQKGWKFKRKWI